MLVNATKTLTLKRLQFLGMITRLYLDQIVPVAARDSDCGMLSLSAGLAISPNPANTSPWENKNINNPNDAQYESHLPI